MSGWVEGDIVGWRREKASEKKIKIRRGEGERLLANQIVQNNKHLCIIYS